MRDGVIGDIEHAKLGICVKAGNLRQGVVRNVEFFEAGEGGETGNGGKAIGLNRKKFQRCQGREVLQDVSMVWERVRGDSLSSRTFISVILFFPSQSCSVEVKVSKFSISCSRQVIRQHSCNCHANTRPA